MHVCVSTKAEQSFSYAVALLHPDIQSVAKCIRKVFFHRSHGKILHGTRRADFLYFLLQLFVWHWHDLDWFGWLWLWHFGFLLRCVLENVRWVHNIFLQIFGDLLVILLRRFRFGGSLPLRSLAAAPWWGLKERNESVGDDLVLAGTRS